MDKENFDMKMPDSESEARNTLRQRAKGITDVRERLALMNRNGIVINGTADDHERVAKMKDRLENLGYHTKMVMVHADDEVSRQRNIARGQRGGRTVPELIRKQKWDKVQAAKEQHKKLFGDHYHEFDNSYDAQTSHPEVKKQKEDEIANLHKTVGKFVAEHPKSAQSNFWIASELQKKDSYKPDPTKKYVPHKDSQAHQHAQKSGLDYYGMGRYGKNGEVTHRSINDRLVTVKGSIRGNDKLPRSSTLSGSDNTTIPPRTKQKMQSAMQGAKQKLPGSQLKEAVSVTITADTPEEFHSVMSSMKTPQQKQTEQYTLSDTDSQDLLNLGKTTTVSEVSTNSETLSNEDVQNIMNNHMKDGSGNLRVFMLRAAAAREAHQKNGEVVKTNNGYIVKLHKENEDVQISKESIHNESGSTDVGFDFKNTTSAQGRILTEGIADLSTSQEYSRADNFDQETIGSSEDHKTKKVNKRKITIEEIRRKQKEKVSESIDKGIEPGVSMAGSGESIGRDTGEKINKKGKASPVIKELTGDETTASIGDQKEDELKKKGINLASFRKRNFV
jgi:hypothetical protein